MGQLLLVEDDPPVRGVLCAMLQRAGHEVIAMDNVGDAVEHVWRTGPLDLAILDLVLQQGSGHEVALVVEQAHPGLPILFISGLDVSTLDASGLLDASVLERDGVAFLQKPFAYGQLVEIVRKLLYSVRARAECSAAARFDGLPPPS